MKNYPLFITCLMFTYGMLAGSIFMDNPRSSVVWYIVGFTQCAALFQTAKSLKEQKKNDKK